MASHVSEGYHWVLISLGISYTPCLMVDLHRLLWRGFAQPLCKYFSVEGMLKCLKLQLLSLNLLTFETIAHYSVLLNLLSIFS